jgi:hypothetical protein
VRGVGHIGIFKAADDADAAAYPADIRFSLSESARVWSASPNSAISSARTALEGAVRNVFVRIGGVETRGLQFAAMAEYLNNKGAVRGNLDEEDIFLARHLYRRASAFAHGRSVKATHVEAAVIWSGVTMICEHAFRKAGIGR